MSDWNSNQYLKFVNERTHPAVDLINRIEFVNPYKIIDIGCGPGNSTNALVSRFTDAYVLGIDYSLNMVKKAKSNYPDVDFKLFDASGDLSALGSDFDIVFSNACIQWLPNHSALLNNMFGLLKNGGILAVQLPDNFDQPIHKIITEVAARNEWSPKFNLPRVFYNLKPEEYYDIISGISENFSIWRTEYFHTMKSCGDIIEWYRSTGLKPYLDVLSESEKAAFENDVFLEVEKAYPIRKNGCVIFKFPRLFFTAEK